MKLANEQKVHINYWVQDIATFKPVKTYDAVGLVYVHLAPDLRQIFHEQACRSLKSGGYLVLEAFAKDRRPLFLIT